MSSKDKQISVIIAGATSSIGRELVSRLVSHPNVQRVVALSRHPISVNRWATVFPNLHTGDALRYLSVVPVDWSKILTDTSRIPFSYVVNGSWHFTEMDACELRKLYKHLSTLHDLWNSPYKNVLRTTERNISSHIEPLTTTTAANSFTNAKLNDNNNHNNNGLERNYNYAFDNSDISHNFVNANNEEYKNNLTSNNLDAKGYVSSYPPHHLRINYKRDNNYQYRALDFNQYGNTTNFEDKYLHQPFDKSHYTNEYNVFDASRNNMNNSNSNNNNNYYYNNNTIPLRNEEEQLSEKSSSVLLQQNTSDNKEQSKFTHSYWHFFWASLTSFLSLPSLTEKQRQWQHKERQSSTSVFSDEIMENRIFMQKLLENNFYNSVFAGHHVAINCLGTAHPLSSSELTQVDYGLSLAFTKVVRLFNCMEYAEVNDEEERELVERISRQLNSELWNEICTACYGRTSSSSSSSSEMHHRNSSASGDGDNSSNKDCYHANNAESNNCRITNKESSSRQTVLRESHTENNQENDGLRRRCSLQHFTQISVRGASERSPIPYLRAHGRRDRDLIKMFKHTSSNHKVNFFTGDRNNASVTTSNGKRSNDNTASSTSQKEILVEPSNGSINATNTLNDNAINENKSSEAIAAEQARTLLLRRDVVHVNQNVNLTIWRPGVFKRSSMRWPEWIISFLEQPLDLRCLAECMVDDIVDSIYRSHESTKDKVNADEEVNNFASVDSTSAKHEMKRKLEEANNVTSKLDADDSAVSSTLKVIGGKSVAQRVFMKAMEDGLDERDTQSPKRSNRNQYTH